METQFKKAYNVITDEEGNQTVVYLVTTADVVKIETSDKGEQPLDLQTFYENNKKYMSNYERNFISIRNDINTLTKGISNLEKTIKKIEENIEDLEEKDKDLKTQFDGVCNYLSVQIIDLQKVVEDLSSNTATSIESLTARIEKLEKKINENG